MSLCLESLLDLIRYQYAQGMACRHGSAETGACQ